ncbi:cilia-and flagella-associated protein 96-like [Nelusetta ayraudi]|uniref:cilia-and flagella-associated protein 96-like n=1 Tax=Nelusetta ayraudi TaxID=303726 RepID=UPI003F720F30
MVSGEKSDDMQRLGVFKEMSYISVGDRFTSSSSRPFNEAAYRGRQMQAGAAKHKCALQSGFFDATFRRVFEREEQSDPVRSERQHRRQQSKRNLGKAFLPCGGAKNPCGSGTYHGTLTQPIEAMSPLLVGQKVHRSPGRNFLTSPPKRGSGYSFPNVTLSRPELYAPDPYDRAREVLKKEAAIHHSRVKNGPFTSSLHPRDYFQSNPFRSSKPLPPAHKPLPAAQATPPVPFKPSSLGKKSGGMKAGTFGAYPLHSADPYVIGPAKRSQAEPVFRPANGPKSTPVKSIITINTHRSVNSANYTSRIAAVMVF